MQAHSEENRILIRDVNLVDVRGGVVAAARDVVVSGDRIETVEPTFEHIPPADRIIDGRGKYLVPGLFDCHVHIAFNGFLNTKNDYEKNLKQFLLYGVTQVVDFFTVGGDFPGSSAETVRDDINSGRILGPWFLTSYGCLNAPGGFCSCSVGSAASAVVTMNDVEKEIKRIHSIKPDFIKIVYDDVFGTLPNLTPDVLGQLIDEAHSRGHRVAVHIAAYEQAREAVERGADILGHGIVDPIPEAFLVEMAQTGVVMIPTLASYEARSLPRSRIPLPLHAPLESLQEYARHERSIYERNGQLHLYRTAYQQAVRNIRPMHDAGVMMVAGSGSGTWYTFPGEGLLRELEIYQEAGLSTDEILKMATIYTAKAFGLEERFGSIEPGKTASLVLLGANPLADISNLRLVDLVMLNGRVLNRNQLQADLMAPSQCTTQADVETEETCSPHHLRRAQATQ